MLASDFQKKLRKLNSKLHIYCGDNPAKPAGVYIINKAGEYEELCGVPKNYINEWPTYDAYGKMTRGGWNRVLRLLVYKKMADRQRTYKYFGRWDEHREPPITTELKPLDNAISQLNKSAVSYKEIVSPLDGSKVTVPVYNNDDVYDVGRMVKKQNDQRLAPASFTESGANLEV